VPADSSADWEHLRCGRQFPARSFDAQRPQLAFQIEWSRYRAGFVPVDVSTFGRNQVARLEQLIAAKGLGPRVLILGRRQ